MELELLPKKIRKIREKQKFKKLSGRLLLGFLLALSMLLIGLSTINFSLNNQNKKLARQSESLKEKITQVKDVESQQVYLISKLGAFQKLVAQQEKHQAVAEAIFSMIPDGTVLKGFDVNQTGSLVLSGSVPDWPTFNLLVNRIRQSSSSNLVVEKALVNKLSFGDKSEISFDINLQLLVH